MTRSKDVRIHEVSFCGDVKSWSDSLFNSQASWPFSYAKIEEYGRGNNKRQDLRVFEKDKERPILCGEVKMPGTPEGRSPYDPGLMQDAFNKADNIQCPYFFTWNVNTFVLFDRSKWQVPMIERRIKYWDLGLQLTTSGDCKRPEVQAYIRDKFLPEFYREFASIVRGEISEWGKPPDDVFIHSLESHLDWPVQGTRDYLAVECKTNPEFAAKLQAWMMEDMQWSIDPNNTEDWRAILERAARTLCYVFCNRAIFYEAIRARFHEVLTKLIMPQSRRGYERIYDYFREYFDRAVTESGDYEPIFYPHVNDWAGALVFASPQAREGWKGVFANLAEYNFRDIPYDVIGGIFQKLIAPEERQKFGQYFTNEDIVDIINSFCIRRAGDTVLDPACGSGSFLVRAYHRKAWLSEQKSGGRRHQDHQKSHQGLLREIFGCDIAVFAAHLATLNLAARHIADEENYPYIARGNFFEVSENKNMFCSVPGQKMLKNDHAKKEKIPVAIPQLDAIVGNPPYVRQEQITKRSQIKRSKGEDRASYESRLKNCKEHMQELCRSIWPGLKLSGRSDLHCYFWPVATGMLKEGGYFGFLTSSNWLDVEYGFPLQDWILQNFKIIAIIESIDEPWFEDARIKTAVTILQRCNHEEERNKNFVKFVLLKKPIKETLGYRSHGDESSRQNAAENLRTLILRTQNKYANEQMQIIPVTQERLWQEGIKAGKLLAKTRQEMRESDKEEEETVEDVAKETLETVGQKYGGGKWGRFLRAPDLYFRLMEEYGDRFVKLGEIAEVRRGITSGCDAFFMPRDVTEQVLAKVKEGLPWNDVGLMKPCKLCEVESGKVRIVKAGDNTLHPVETEYLRPEVHSLMQVDRPVIRAKDLDRVVLWVNQPLHELKGTYVSKYIRWGAKQTFASKKSKAVPVPQRSTCASRPLWYDLTSSHIGIAFWPKAQQYRHIIPANPEELFCNCNLYTVVPIIETEHARCILSAILNSTLVALMKTYYGRYAGTEGNLKTEVIDVNLLDIPDPRYSSMEIAKRLKDSLSSLQKRKVTHLVEEELMSCHDLQHARELGNKSVSLSLELQQNDRQMLDDAVLEIIGISNRKLRKSIIDELYKETALYFRQIRIVEIQKQIQRSTMGIKRLTAHDLATSIWDSFKTEDKPLPLTERLSRLSGDRMEVDILDGRAQALGSGHMFEPSTVIFSAGKEKTQVAYESAEQAELVELLAALDIRGKVKVPQEAVTCKDWKKNIQEQIKQIEEQSETLAGSRTGNEKLREQVSMLLKQWFIHGR